MRLLAMILIVALFLNWATVNPACAAFNPSEIFQTGANQRFFFFVFTLGTIGFSALSYYIYKNSPAQRERGYEIELGPGEWYVGGYTGLSYLPSADWKLNSNFPPAYHDKVAKGVFYEPAILGGVKFGRYFNKYPWFGIEVETNFSRNNLRPNQGKISPPVPGGPPILFTNSDWFMIWVMQLNLLARYGFLQDKEIPFGRLQPYVGIGPGFEVIYGSTDSAKNLAYEGLAGIRYMCTRNVGIFFEYKFSYQSKVEYENIQINKDPKGLGQGTAQLDVPHHRFVVGVAYHFKNLYGN
ncbi:MAG: outer membrane protein [Thermodesulfobacteriota bacterium]